MKTKLVSDTIEVQLTKPEQASVGKVLSLCQTLAKMQPIAEEVHDAADTACTSLGRLLALIGEGKDSDATEQTQPGTTPA